MDTISARLQEKGITTKSLKKTASTLYFPYGVSKQEADADIAAMIERMLDDGTVASLISAAIYLDDTGIKQKDKECITGLKSPAIIGTAIAESIGGTYAYFEYTRFSRKDLGVVKAAHPFLHEALAGLIAGCTSRLYSTALSADTQKSAR
ncbi:MAG: phosphatidylglycerophosphatase A [Methanospirillaceae archaeon]|nr:phosphatidylglycerophosphatase A [Methanospirillaceae archaeon]